MAARIQAGAVTINDHLMSHGLPETPWGGFKESGIGRTHGKLGFEEMTQPQVIIHDLLGGTRANMWWHPHDRTIYEGLLGLMKARYSKQRGRGAKNLARILPNMFKER